MLKLFLFRNRLFFLFMLSCMGMFENSNARESTPPDSLKNVLIAKEKEMFDVISSGDKAAAEKLFGQDYITVNADGVMQEKEETMKTFGKFKGSESLLFDKKIRVYGNIALINGRAKAYVKSVLVADFLYTETWIFRGEKWEFIGWQGTMTGLPSWYPVIITALFMLLLYFIIRTIIKKIKRSPI